MTPDHLLIAIEIGAIAAVCGPVIAALQGPPRPPLIPLVAHLSGMLAGYGVVVLLALMSRMPALERGVGADVLARWHARGGRLVMGLILLHAWTAVVSWAHARNESTPVALGDLLRLPWLMAATAGTLLLAGVAIVSVRRARRRMSYETWHAIHLLTYLGIALSFLHQLAGPDMAGHRLLQIGWALLYAYVFALVLIHRVVTPLDKRRDTGCASPP